MPVIIARIGVSIVIRGPCARRFGLIANHQAARTIARGPYSRRLQYATSASATSQTQSDAIRARGSKIASNSSGWSIHSPRPSWSSVQSIGTCWSFQKVSGEPARVIRA